MHRKAGEIATVEPQNRRTIVSGSQLDAGQVNGGSCDRAKGTERSASV
jgi:hypothetical protein